jgi:hypothetical protein
VRLPLVIAIAVLLAGGALAGVITLGSAADAGPRPVEPILVEAPAVPADPGAAAPEPAPQAPQPAPRDDDGYVAPPPPVDDDDDDDDGPGDDDADDGPDDDD